MLCGQAGEYCFNKLCRQKLTLNRLADQIQTRFKNEEKTRALFRNGELLILSQPMSSQPRKADQECLELLVRKLHDIQASLPAKYRTDLMMKNRFPNTVWDVDQCHLACHKPADTVEEVILDFLSSIFLLESSSRSLLAAPSVHIADRR